VTSRAEDNLSAADLQIPNRPAGQEPVTSTLSTSKVPSRRAA
jgi:hypothetical protein